jgi:uncharacterized protein YndB with AHSA1/START domain
MTVIDVHKDPATLTMRFTATYAAPVEQVWSLWADPRRLERWWGPPMYPATFVEHDLRPGGRVSYYMTSPEGEQYHGWWRVASVDAPTRLSFEDGFADDAGEPNPELPVTVSVIEITAQDDGMTRMELVTTFPSLEAMEQVLSMGAEEGMRAAMGQIDAILAG